MSEGRRKGPVCGVENCRSRFYDEGEDGYRYCENGHRKGDLVVGLDEDNFTSEARVRTRKKKNLDESEKEHKYYRGQQAYELYLESLQLILRHQIWFLVQTKGLPAELENIVFEFWALRILPFEAKITTERLEYDSQSGYSAPESGFDSESGFESDGEGLASERKDKLGSSPTLLECLALCYMAMLTLRLPVTPGDIYKWTMEEDMAYKRAIKYIPPVMKDRLPSQYHATLNPNAALKLERLHSAITSLQISFAKRYGITWPRLNHPLLLFRYLKELALPLELYDATFRLAGILKYDFTLHTTKKGRFSVRDLPEPQLLACLVVCTKLIYPFDDEQRHPRTTSEPAATKIVWEEWYDAIVSAPNRSDEVPKLTIEELTSTKDKDMLSMSGDQMDQYMDWYQDNFIEESQLGELEDGQFRNALYNMFPIDAEPRSYTTPNAQPDIDDEARSQVIRMAHGAIEPVSVIREGEEMEETLRPGQKYPFYKTEKDLPLAARRFYEEAAKIAGLPLGTLVNAVFYAEKAIQKWQKGRNGQAEEGLDGEKKA